MGLRKDPRLIRQRGSGAALTISGHYVEEVGQSDGLKSHPADYSATIWERRVNQGENPAAALMIVAGGGFGKAIRASAS